eukprot:187842-Pelagomonas_calceolata.AAC.1
MCAYAGHRKDEGAYRLHEREAHIASALAPAHSKFNSTTKGKIGKQTITTETHDHPACLRDAARVRHYMPEQLLCTVLSTLLKRLGHAASGAGTILTLEAELGLLLVVKCILVPKQLLAHLGEPAHKFRYLNSTYVQCTFGPHSEFWHPGPCTP